MTAENQDMTTPSKTEEVPLEHPELVAAKLQMLLENFGPVCNDKEARYIVKLALRALDQPAPDTNAEPVDPDAPKVTGSPEEIWLVYGDIDENGDHDEFHEVVWCGHQVGNADVRYVRADLASRASPSQPAEPHSQARSVESYNERVLNLLHDRIGLCGHCGKKKCAGRHGNSQLPGNINLNVLLQAMEDASNG